VIPRDNSRSGCSAIKLWDKKSQAAVLMIRYQRGSATAGQPCAEVAISLEYLNLHSR